MKRFNRIVALYTTVMTAIMIVVNLSLIYTTNQISGGNRIDKVELISEQGEQVSLDGYQTILGVYAQTGHSDFSDSAAAISNDDDFFASEHDYVIREINGTLYRIEYSVPYASLTPSIYIIVNLALLSCALILLLSLMYVKKQILTPFHEISDLPYELSKGNLTVPLRESKNKYFGRFLWGLDMLRETLEQTKQRELAMQKEKKTLLLSLSHDIKTPLSAIKLYAKALSRQLYQKPDTKTEEHTLSIQEQKQLEIAARIDAKADEIEGFVQEIMQASNQDFLRLEVKNSEFYLSHAMAHIRRYYGDMLSSFGTSFQIQDSPDCLLKGDIDRLVEVLQNIIENAIKYGDSRDISILFSDEENCRLITVQNSGCTLPDAEIDHVFESFWRGSNAGRQQGSGLGLYICRQLMNAMGGEIFAKISEGHMLVTVVCVKA